MRQFSELAAILASICVLIYTPFGIMALSYNSMGILLLLNTCVILASAQKHQRLQLCIAGLFFAGSVLCNPYLVIVWILSCPIAVWAAFAKRRELLRKWLFFTLGCGALAVLFLLFVIARSASPKLVYGFKEIFNDPEHPHQTLARKTYTYLRAILKCNRVFAPCVCGMVIVFVLALLFHKPYLGFPLICLLDLFIEICFLHDKPYINYIMFPINLTGIYCAAFMNKSRQRVFVRFTLLIGLIYTYCIHLTSNQKFYVISSASTVMCYASIFAVIDFVKAGKAASDKAVRNTMLVAAALLMLVQLYAEYSLRYQSVFWEKGMQGQTVLETEGPDKGLLLSPKKDTVYRQDLQDASAIREHTNIKSILFFSEKTYMYLCAEKENAAYSAWLSGCTEKTVQRLEAYYALVPEKIPDAIYIDQNYTQFQDMFLTDEYESQALNSGAVLLVKKGN